jgi:hypothetical protein
LNTEAKKQPMNPLHVSPSHDLPPCPFDREQLHNAFAPVLGNQSFQVCQVLSGTINTIVKVHSGGRYYALRARTQENIYRYEPDLIKEAFVAWLMNHTPNIPCDAEAAVAFTHIRAAQCGTREGQCSILPSVLYYDWSRRLLPLPYCIYEWVEGISLRDTPQPHLYERAGQALTHIHAIRFSHFYADFPSIGTAPVNWSDRYRVALDKEITAARGRLDDAMRQRLVGLAIPTSLSCTPRLVHNDFAPGNILVRDGTIAAVIDWDNAVIDAAPLDFVKMKYWTAKSPQGELSHQPSLFSAFIDGYGPAGREIVESFAFLLYEFLWLLRVFNFERAKDEQGLDRTPGYPAAAVYEEYLTEVLSRLTQYS